MQRLGVHCIDNIFAIACSSNSIIYEERYVLAKHH